MAVSDRQFGILKYFVASVLSLVITPTLSGQESNPESSESRFPKLEFRKWSGDINVPDPVSVSMDDQGRVYATQTRRRKIQDLDIRQHSEWIPDDLAMQSVEDKRSFLKRKLAIGGDQSIQSKHVRDLNQDGQHDWRDLQVVSEAIYQLSDTNDDGTADEMKVFAEDFQTEVTGIAAGVLAHDGSVWATIAPDVWKLTDTDGDGQADQREVMAHGFGLHLAYAGHDMHGLTVGPDGKIYWSIGDKGINVRSDDGEHHFFPNQGGVLRCNPDGTDFEVFAHGLRNVQELAFDKFGNLFGVDNDSDQPSEKERFVYIVNGMDAGWRCNYQYRKGNYNPWVDERLWELPGVDHAAYFIPPLNHYVDGPAGFVYNPGTALSPEYYDYFFLTSAPNGQQYAFRTEPKGDSFQMADEHQIGSGIAIVGWNWGPDGRLYGADWDGGYPLDEKGSIVCVDAPGAEVKVRKEVQTLLSEGFRERTRQELAMLLTHQDQRVRLNSQFELVNRDQGKVLGRIALATDANSVTRLHAIWGLGQLARGGNQSAINIIATLFDDEDDHVRGQAVKTFGEARAVDGKLVVPLLDDDSEYVRTLAANALARHGTPSAIPHLLRQAGRLSPDQHYLRYSHSWALSRCATAEQLSAPANRSASIMGRMCCLLALRHQRSPLAATYLDDPSDRIATEAARAIHDDFSIDGGMLALAQSLNSRASQTEAFARRAINANYRQGTDAAVERVVKFAADRDRPAAMRLEAIDALSDWNEHTALDRVDGRNRHLSPRELNPSLIEEELTSVVGSDNAKLRTAALIATQRLGVALPDPMLAALVRDPKLDDALRAAALAALSARNTSVDLAELSSQALRSEALKVRQQAIKTLCSASPSQGVAAAAKLIQDKSQPIALRQSSVRSLANVSGSETLLKKLLSDFQESKLDRSLALDLFETWKSDERMTTPETVDLLDLARDGGDISRGRVLFQTHSQAQCSRCHRVGRKGSDIGPELSRIGKKRDADYLLRAIVTPSADIDQQYRTHLYVLDTGELLKGVPISQSDTETKIADSSGNELTLANDAILESKVQTISLMPDMRDVLAPAEVRDLVAYLRSLKAK